MGGKGGRWREGEGVSSLLLVENHSIIIILLNFITNYSVLLTSTFF